MSSSPKQLIDSLEGKLFELILQGREIKRQKKRIRAQIVEEEMKQQQQQQKQKEEQEQETLKQRKRTRRGAAAKKPIFLMCPCGSPLLTQPELEIGVCYGNLCLRKDGNPRSCSIPLNYYGCSSDLCQNTICQSCFKHLD